MQFRSIEGRKRRFQSRVKWAFRGYVALRDDLKQGYSINGCSRYSATISRMGPLNPGGILWSGGQRTRRLHAVRPRVHSTRSVTVRLLTSHTLCCLAHSLATTTTTTLRFCPSPTLSYRQSLFFYKIPSSNVITGHVKSSHQAQSRTRADSREKYFIFLKVCSLQLSADPYPDHPS